VAKTTEPVKSFLAIWAVTALLCEISTGGSPATAASPNIRFHQGTSAREIPFSYEQMHIIVTVKVADALEIPMLLDTGFGFDGAILLDPEIGDRMGLEYVSEVQLGGGGGERPMTAKVAIGADLSLPGVTFSQQKLLVVNDATPYANYPAQGIIGKTVFDCAVEIDYDESALHLYDSASYAYDGSEETFDFEFSHGIPVIDAAVSIAGGGDVPVKMLVDTGASQLLLFTFSTQALHEPQKVIEGSTKLLSKGFTGTVRGSTGRITHLRLGKHTLEGVSTSFPDEESWGKAGVLGQNGMIGNDVLRRFFVVFDYSRQRIHLRPGRHIGDAFDWDMAGLVTEHTCKGTLDVLDVIVGSPAMENDIRPGDAIVAVDGRPVKGLTDSEIWNVFTRDGAHVKVTIDRSGENLEKILVLRRMI